MNKELEFKKIKSIVSNKDMEEFGELFLPYEERIIKSVTGVTKDINIAKDITQDTFLNAFSKLETFRFESTFYTWLYSIAINLAKDYLRKRKSQNTCQLEIDYDTDKSYNLSPSGLDPYHNMINKESMNFLRSVMSESLSDKHNKTLSLYIFDNKSYKEIAEELDVPVGTIMSRISCAREILQKEPKLIEYLEDK